MDWERHLAAALQCTDAHLAQRFQQLNALNEDEDATEDAGSLYLEFVPEPARPVPTAAARAMRPAPVEELRPLEGPSVAAAYLREAAPAASFSDHFRRRQQQRKQAARSASDNQQPVDEPVDERPQVLRSGHHVSFQTFASPSYDVAHMMEQVRLSLKLEVDARAAIAERQLGALLQLSKASGDELDRLRVEVAASDRQLHSLEQTQHKLRQEVATQKDIAFHLQALCGKDETWRMQAESQLLELRQMVAALREQANTTQVAAQEKLSRNELLVHFNAAMEPVKAQLQASTHHQTQQIGEVSRSASSSALLLDAVMQKINHALPSELADLRNDVSALKVQLSKIAGGRIEQPRENEEQIDAARSKREREARERDELQLKELVDRTRREITSDIRTFVTDELKLVQRKCDELASGGIRRQDVEAMLQRVEDRFTNQVVVSVTQTEKQMKAVESQLHTEFGHGLRDLLKQIEQAKSGMLETTKTADARADSWENRYTSLSKRLDKELEDRRIQMSETHEKLRVVQNELQQSTQSWTQDIKLQQSQAAHEAEKRSREVEKRVDELFEKCQKESRSRFTDLESMIKSIDDRILAKCDRRMLTVEDSLVKTNSAMDALAMIVKDLKATNSNSSNQITDKMGSKSPGRDDIRAALEKQTSAFVSAIDASMQRMQLQLQLQLQAQSHPPVVVPAPTYPSQWVLSPTATSIHHAQPAFQTATQAPTIPASTTTSSSPTTQTVVETGAPVLKSLKSLTASTATETPPVPTANQPSLSVVAQRDIDKVQSNAVTRADGKLKNPLEAQDSNISISAGMVLPTSTADGPGPSKVSVHQPPEPRSSIDKIQDTITTSARGALAEAELAKARVESRRKHEQEFRQHQIPQALMTPLTRGTPVLAPRPAIEIGSSGRIPPPPPPLVRATSTSDLPIRPGEPESKSPPSPGRRPSTGSVKPSIHQAVGNSAIGPSIPYDTIPKAEPENSATPPLMAKTPLEPPQLVPAPLLSSKITSVSPTEKESQASLPAKEPKIESQKSSDKEQVQAKVLTSASSDTNSCTVPQSNHVPELSSTNPTETSKPNSPSVMFKLFGNMPKSPQRDLAQGLTTTTSVPPPPPPPPIATMTASKPEQVAVPSPSSNTGSFSPAHVLCSLCRLPIRREQREEHEKNQCPRRLVECSACNAKMLWINLDVHSKTCSSSRIEDSGTDVVLQNSIASTTSNLTAPTGSDDMLKKCRHCSADVAAPELLEHEARCDKVLKQCPHCLRRQKMSELQEHIENCDCRLVSCPNDCGGKFLQRGIEKHLSTRCPKSPGGSFSQGSIQGEIPRKSAPSTSTPATPQSQSSTGGLESSSIGATLGQIPGKPTSTIPGGVTVSRPGSMLDNSRLGDPPVTRTTTSIPQPEGSSSTGIAKAECKFCDEEFPANTIDDHETDCNWRPKRCQHCNMVIISRDLARHEASCKTSFKSCQHCNESMPQSALSTHSTRCPKRPIKCIRCCQLFPADAIVAHSTSCKFVPSATASAATPPPPVQPIPPPPRSSSSSVLASQPAPVASPLRAPPPPPNPSVSTLNKAVNDPTRLRTASADSSSLLSRSIASSASMPPDESEDTRMARRSLALSQLTNPGSIISSATVPVRNTSEISVTSGPHPELDDDGDEDADGGEEDEEDEEDELTLAQVVAEWTVENVCVWLHEDVGVPDVVPRFQQRRCNGAMLLELTESDLVNDFGIRNRIHRERILNAIEAVKMSDSMSEEDDDDDDDYVDDGDDAEEEEDDDDDGATVGASYGGRGSQIPPSQRQAGDPLPSSNAMFRRINSALDIPKK